MTTTYPTELPSEDIRTLFEIITGRRDRDVKAAAKAGWVVQGYLQGALLGDPAKASAAGFVTLDINTHTNISDAQGAAILGALVQLETQPTGDVEAAGIGDLLGGALGNVLKRQLAGLILPLLQRWLTEWLQGGGLEDLIRRIVGGIGGSGSQPGRLAAAGSCSG